jgi:hypothetical protein
MFSCTTIATATPFQLRERSTTVNTAPKFVLQYQGELTPPATSRVRTPCQFLEQAAATDGYKAAYRELEVLKDDGKAIGHTLSDLGAAYLAPLVRDYLSQDAK